MARSSSSTAAGCSGDLYPGGSGGGSIRGDFGESFIQRGFTVNELIRKRMLISAQLGFLALVVVFGTGIPARAARRALQRHLDRPPS